MRSLRAGIRNVSRVSLLLVAVAVTVVALGHDARPVTGATGTRIVISESSTSPIPVSTPFILYPNGPSVDLYVWAENIKDPFGPHRLGGFDIYFTYDNSLMSITALSPDTTFLTSTGRQASCIPPFWASSPPYVQAIPNDPDGRWEGTVGCHTLDGATPFGPVGTGLIGSLTLTPNPAVVPPDNSTLNFAVPIASNPLFTYLTVLIDTGGVSGETVTPPAEIAATVPTVSVLMIRCADFDGDGQVAVPGDILPLILRYAMTSSHPDWDDIYDLNGDGTIDVVNDILGAIFQYLNFCTQPA